MLVSEVLAKAADLIEPEGKWIQGAYARDKNGISLAEQRDSTAVCFCALGAIARAWNKSFSDAHDWEMSLGNEIPGVSSLGAWNDQPCRTQAEVVAKLREAAVLARGQGK